MTFTPLNFRTLSPDNAPPKIRTLDSSPLITVSKSGFAHYARTRGDKDKLIANYKPADLLLFAWTGQHHTDVFILTQTDIDAHYR